jgi:hypothetical protein
MRTIYLYTLFLFMGITVYAQKIPLSKDSLEDIKTYDYQTKLIGGYKILLETDNSTEYLYLTSKSKKIAELSSGSRGMLYKNLGYVGADFREYFVLVHSFGSGNPNEIELIKKSTGKNILITSACWIDIIEKKEILLYSNQGVPVAKDNMILYNIRTGQKRYFHFPKDIFNEPMILHRIKVKTLTDKFLTIEYETNGRTKTKKYLF